MQLLLILLLGFFVVVLGKNCDKLGTLVYEDMACKPIYNGKTVCPSKYKCTGIEPSKTCCYFKNKCVKVGKKSDPSLSPICPIGCTCQKDITFSCDSVECPECHYMDYKENCYTNETFNDCCNCREICPPFSDTKCVVDGETYKEGELFRPKDTCWECVCRKGWRGVNEAPFCQRRRCGVQLFSQQAVQNACAPAYMYNGSPDEPLCCPYGWICPNTNDTIKGKPSGHDVCKFGNTTLKVGQYVPTLINIWIGFDIHFTCNCTLPPLLTCTVDLAYYNITDSLNNLES